jgi:hypothetical protein
MGGNMSKKEKVLIATNIVVGVGIISTIAIGVHKYKESNIQGKPAKVETTSVEKEESKES